METKIAYTPTFLRKRKFLVVLPVLILPFLTLAFWALGGGKVVTATGTSRSSGLNTHLPEARNKEEKGSDKLALYEQADQEATRRKQNQGPSFSLDTTAFTPSLDAAVSQEQSPYRAYDPAPPAGSPEVVEASLYQKLADVNRQLQANTAVATQQHTTSSLPHFETASQTTATSNTDRLKEILSDSGTAHREADPELQQLNAMMDKVLDIQHPARVKENIAEQSKITNPHVFGVRRPKASDSMTLLTSSPSVSNDSALTPVTEKQHTLASNGFYSLQSDTSTPQTVYSIEAIIDQTQTVVSGATIKLRLLSDVMINDLLLPRDQCLYGITTLQGERLLVHIPSIRYSNQLLPVDLSVYDLDGLEGIYVPGTITGDATRQASENILQGVEVGALNHSLATDIARAGMEASKSLFAKKARLVKVTIKAGYRVLLQDNKQQQNSLSY